MCPFSLLRVSELLSLVEIAVMKVLIIAQFCKVTIFHRDVQLCYLGLEIKSIYLFTISG